jgi:hypothetical protein
MEVHADQQVFTSLPKTQGRAGVAQVMDPRAAGLK